MNLFATLWKGIIRRTWRNELLNDIMFFYYFCMKSAFLSAVINVIYFVSITIKWSVYEVSISFALWYQTRSEAVKISKVYQISIFFWMALAQVAHGGTQPSGIPDWWKVSFFLPLKIWRNINKEFVTSKLPYFLVYDNHVKGCYVWGSC